MPQSLLDHQLADGIRYGRHPIRDAKFLEDIVGVVPNGGGADVESLSFADPLGLGRSPGLGWRQTLGVIIGGLLIAAGIYVRRQ
jgi:hypothetical protein